MKLSSTSWYVNGQEVRYRIHTTGALSGYQVLGTNMDTGASYGKTDVQRNSSYATLASYKIGSSMTRERWTYEGYQTGYTSDIRRTVVDNLRFLTVYYEVDTRNTWYYNYTKTLTDLYPDGTIIPSTERTVADEQVQYIEDGISQWTEYKSASQLAEENMLYLSQHYKIP
ncbi:hypothetical protein, partial [Ornithinibacillus contaminans]|uniref:hypothetical protein n=1 Tax=Ornithinibacillus contaminans TaxID=694055 RepID=UPI0012EE1DFB